MSQTQEKLEKLQNLMVALRAVEKEKRDYMTEIKDQIKSLKEQIDALVTELDQENPSGKLEFGED
jgi:peptidoglycan hydrolase CwlO-like protein